MKRLAIPIISMLLVTSLVYAADDVKTAKVLAVKAYHRGRIAFWEGRVPIYDGYPFYDITLALDQKKYVVRYESMTGYFPSSWKAGNEIQVRLGARNRCSCSMATRKFWPSSTTDIRRTACHLVGGQPHWVPARRCLATEECVFLTTALHALN